MGFDIRNTIGGKLTSVPRFSITDYTILFSFNTVKFEICTTHSINAKDHISYYRVGKRKNRKINHQYLKSSCLSI